MKKIVVAVMFLCCLCKVSAQVVLDTEYDYMLGLEAYSLDEKCFSAFAENKGQVLVSAHQCKNAQGEYHALVIARTEISKGAWKIVLASNDLLEKDLGVAVQKASENAYRALQSAKQAIALEATAKKITLDAKNSTHPQHEKLLRLATLAVLCQTKTKDFSALQWTLQVDAQKIKLKGIAEKNGQPTASGEQLIGPSGLTEAVVVDLCNQLTAKLLAVKN